MKDQTQSTKVKKAKSLDDEIAAAQERLNRLQAQKREKERRDLERNQKAIATFLRAEKLDMVPVEKWTEALPALRRVLKAEEPKTAARAGSEFGTKSAAPGASGQAGSPGQSGKSPALETAC